MFKVVVTIPIYKSAMDDMEIVSLRQTFRVLKSYPIVLVCPDGLDINEYHRFAFQEEVELQEERFAPLFFRSIEGYNRLLLSSIFYRRFAQYEYLLICQTDAFVFKDELDKWCKKGYDYIGAPLFGGFSDTVFYKERARVGNGGFSLRRVRTYIDFFQGKKNVIKTKDIASRISFRKKPYTRWLIWLLMLLGWRNKPRSFANHWKYNEDDFWSGVLDGTNYALKKPSVSEALHFAFERFPSDCYKLIGELPFGCHAWKKYEYEEFWKNYI